MINLIKRLLERLDGSNRDHAEGCWDWGSYHYECARDEVKRWRQELLDVANSLWQEHPGDSRAQRIYDLLDYAPAPPIVNMHQVSEKCRPEGHQRERSQLLAANRVR